MENINFFSEKVVPSACQVLSEGFGSVPVATELSGMITTAGCIHMDAFFLMA